jgi:glycosyltransferase involved in cell wall biosynthesis
LPGELWKRTLAAIASWNMANIALKRLLIEGWRHLAHSYALVAQAHCLSLLKRADVDLRFRDLPYFSSDWKPTPGIFSAAEEQALASMRAPEVDFTPDATFTIRPERPDFAAAATGHKFVYATAEFRILLEEHLGVWRSSADVSPSVSVITPSHWSALAFERFGLPAARIHVVPHGIDPALHRPDATARDAMRERLALGDDFLFVSVGAMSWNKGLDILLAAFGRVLETHPTARLLLKGADALYPSKAYVAEVMNELPSRAREAVARRLIYLGGTLPAAKMGDLLRAADCYVSPYRAEGFNMPVLEAAACGVASICTAHGPTDEFTRPEWAWRIHSAIVAQRLSATEVGELLLPDRDHLTDLMREAASNPDRIHALGEQASSHAHAHFTWDRLTDALLGAMFPQSG